MPDFLPPESVRFELPGRQAAIRLLVAPPAVVSSGGPTHLTRMSRAYSAETWELYAQLDQSLDPAGPDSLVDLAAEFLSPGARILDAGCRDAAYLIRLVEQHDATGVGVDPVAIHAERARAAVEAAGLTNRIDIVHSVLEAAAIPAGPFDLVWCRDVLEQVEQLPAFLTAAARQLGPAGRMIAYTNISTDRLERSEAELLGRHLGHVHANLDERRLLAAFAGAGLVVERRDVIGTQWREYAEERTQPVAQSLLRLARLRRRRDTVIAERGQDVYDHVEANLHWLLFQFLGKIEPVTYVLRPGPAQPVAPRSGRAGGDGRILAMTAEQSHGEQSNVERLEVERTIAASPATIFALLCDPQGHVAIDSSGMLMDATGEPVAAVGDTFVVHMDREALNDYPLGEYDVTVTITTFVPDREIAWTVKGRIRPQIGHVYGYLLAPTDRGTRVTSYYDWSSADPHWKDSGVLPVLSAGALRATLGILARTIARSGRDSTAADRT